MKDHILLDNGSTLSLFTNPELVVNIRKADDVLQLATNTGVKFNNEKAEVPNFGEVWYDKDAIANIIGFADLLSKSNRITYDSAKEDAFIVHLPDGKLKLKRTAEGLYAFKPHKGFIEDNLQQKPAGEQYWIDSINAANDEEDKMKDAKGCKCLYDILC